jgi:hypothetical protein
MKHITTVTALLVGALFFASPSRAQTPCDFKGISVGTKMDPAEIMAGLGITKYKMNPAQSSFGDLALQRKYGIIPAAELEEWDVGPYCNETSCRVPYGVTVGNSNTPVNVFVSFHDRLIKEIEVSFNEMYWDQMLPILDQKYGADWKVDRSYTAITDYETKKNHVAELISLTHISNGMNQSTKDDAYGPYHSLVVIKLISKNF